MEKIDLMLGSIVLAVLLVAIISGLIWNVPTALHELQNKTDRPLQILRF